MALANVDINLRHQLVLQIPLEVLYRIINWLELGDILALSSSCKSLYAICQSPETYEHLTLDRKINVKKLLRKCDRHYFVKTRSVSWNSSPLKAHSLLEGKLQSFPKLTSINFSHCAVNLELISQLAEYIGHLQSVKLCVGVPHVFPSSGYWSLDQCNQLKLVLIGLLSHLLQAESIRDLLLVFTLKDSICNIQSRSDLINLCLDLTRVPRRVRIENFALFHFEVKNHFLLFSKSHCVEQFLLRQFDSGINNITVPISFCVPADSLLSDTQQRRLYLEHNAIANSASLPDTCLTETSFNRDYRCLNLIPEAFLGRIEFGNLSFLDLSRVSANVSTKISLDSLHNLRGLNISGQASLLLEILERVQASVLFPSLRELNVSGIQCCQLFDRVPKRNLMLLVSRLKDLRSLTLTPCMTLLPSNWIEREHMSTHAAHAYHSAKILKLDSFGICVSQLFRYCPRLEALTVTDKTLVQCQLCIYEYENLKQTRKFLNPSSESAPAVLSRFSLFYKQGVIDNYSAILLEEISSHQLTTLTHFSIQTNRNFLCNILFKFLNNNSDLITLRIDSPINFTHLVFKALNSLTSLQNLFLIGSAASDIDVLERVIAELPQLSVIWLCFKNLSGKQGKELQSRLMQLKEVRAVHDSNLTVNYSNRESHLASRMYASIVGYLYSKSEIR